jgi:hypothetical protein
MQNETIFIMTVAVRLHVDGNDDARFARRAG